MLLDPAKSEQDWLVALTEAAERAFGPERVAAGRAGLERLSHALTVLAAAGPEVDLRARDAARDDLDTGGQGG